LCSSELARKIKQLEVKGACAPVPHSWRANWSWVSAIPREKEGKKSTYERRRAILAHCTENQGNLVALQQKAVFITDMPVIYIASTSLIFTIYPQ